MRKLGIEVDCAADVTEARAWWRADLYDLVLVNVQEMTGTMDKFFDDMRNATPIQQVMFLVGKPEYLATVPKTDTAVVASGLAPLSSADVKAALAAVASEHTGRWGILEACRRISAVRHVSEAKARAIRNLPLPPRDSEISQLKRARAIDLLDQTMTEKVQ
jgi:DNA-binding response OmpR family regulator